MDRNPLLGMSERTLSEKERYEMILNPGDLFYKRELKKYGIKYLLTVYILLPLKKLLKNRGNIGGYDMMMKSSC